MAIISGYDHYGRGITKIDNKICFVENAIIGEDVEIKVISSKKNYNECIIEKYIKKSNNHIDSPCPYYDKCGGCNILHLSYDEQLKFKQNKIENIMHKYVDNNIKINNIVKSDKQFHYRNKVTLHKNNNNIGMYNKNSNDIIKIDKCLLIDDLLNANLDKISDKLIMRTNGKEILNDDTNTILCNIGDYKFNVSLESFFQINNNVTKKLYDKIKDSANITKKDILLDLYCGTGTIGIYLADKADKVIGVEINQKAIDNANNNKIINNINNIDFICSDVAKIVNDIKIKPNIVVVDPPRAGLDNKTKQYLKKLKADKVIYVSCDPMTLARDLKELKDIYNIEEVTPFDMFPNTYHVESLCILNKK